MNEGSIAKDGRCGLPCLTEYMYCASIAVEVDAMTLLGQRFNVKHAAGVTRFQVNRAHRDAGYFECVAVRGVSGTHHFIGSIQVFSRSDIEQAMQACERSEAADGWCRNEFCRRHGAVLAEDVREEWEADNHARAREFGGE
jgi:hypothetical protein